MMGEAEAAAAARRGIRFLKITTRVVLPRECEKGPKKEGRKGTVFRGGDGVQEEGGRGRPRTKWVRRQVQ